ncbi:hypothetical protein O181_037176 [Austropuccinia psidii MF-1]|uniref:Integrase catalytic domain-containing protein n=1 Tax=Austropuccinia psidii MF-1 TaxID=1389203 RepID=A0A9Q3D5P5_9BASI|nr:hypothetical protein [Austropuccinia psidii MF-1]
MDWVTALPPGGDRSYNACLVVVDRYSKTPIFLPCHEDDTAMDTDIMIWNKFISHTCLFQSIISDRDPKFTSALCTNLNNLFGTTLSLSTAYHPQTHEFKDSYRFTHGWCTLIPALELKYKTSIHSSTGKTLAMLEKGLNPRLPYDALKKELVDIHPTASSLKIIVDKARHHANRFMQESFKYAKERWVRSHKTPEFKVGNWSWYQLLILIILKAKRN